MSPELPQQGNYHDIMECEVCRVENTDGALKNPGFC